MGFYDKIISPGSGDIDQPYFDTKTLIVNNCWMQPFQAFTCLKSTLRTLEKGGKYIQS